MPTANDLKVTRQSPIPLYFQVENILQHQILEGKYQPGDQIPTEQELCEQFNVSRSVIRPALQNLVQHGLIERIPGRGSFVSHHKVQESLIKELLGFYEDTVLRGHRPTTSIIEQSQIPATPEIASKLGIEHGELVLYLKRLRYVDEEPHLLSHTYLRLDDLPGIVDEDFSRGSLYDHLANRYGIVIAHGKRIVEAVLATEEDSALLGIPLGAPILLLTSLVHRENGDPLEYSIGRHRADRTRFEVELLRSQRGYQEGQD